MAIPKSIKWNLVTTRTKIKIMHESGPPGHTFQPNTMYIQLLFKNWGFYHSKNVFSGLPSLFYESSKRLNSNTNKACIAPSPTTLCVFWIFFYVMNGPGTYQRSPIRILPQMWSLADLPCQPTASQSQRSCCCCDLFLLGTTTVDFFSEAEFFYMLNISQGNFFFCGF